MSVYVRLASCSGEPRLLWKIISYITDSQKTDWKFCHGTGLSVEHAAEDMLFLKQLHCKRDGRQYLHHVVSFDANVTIDVADEVGKEILALYSPKYQAVMAIHTNTANLHCHYIINSVAVDGKKFSESRNDMLGWRDKINEILDRHGLNAIGRNGTVNKDSCTCQNAWPEWGEDANGLIDDNDYADFVASIPSEFSSLLEKGIYAEFTDELMASDEVLNTIIQEAYGVNAFSKKGERPWPDYELIHNYFLQYYYPTEDEIDAMKREIEEQEKGDSFFDKF